MLTTLTIVGTAPFALSPILLTTLVKPGVLLLYVYPAGIYGGADGRSLPSFQEQPQSGLRIPKALAFPENVSDVEIMKLGSSRIIIPAGKNWSEYFANGPFVTDDFMIERKRWDFEEREPL